MRKKVLALILGVTMVGSIFTGCGTKEESKKLDSNVSIEELQSSTSERYKSLDNISSEFTSDGVIKVIDTENKTDVSFKVDGNMSSSENLMHINLNLEFSDAEDTDKKVKIESYIDYTDKDNLTIYTYNDGADENWYVSKGMTYDEFLDSFNIESSKLDESMTDLDLFNDTEVKIDGDHYVIEKTISGVEVMDLIADTGLDSELASVKVVLDILANNFEVKAVAKYNSDKVLSDIDLSLELKKVTLGDASFEGHINLNASAEDFDGKIEIPESVVNNAKESDGNNGDDFYIGDEPINEEDFTIDDDTDNEDDVKLDFNGIEEE